MYTTLSSWEGRAVLKCMKNKQLAEAALPKWSSKLLLNPNLSIFCVLWIILLEFLLSNWQLQKRALIVQNRNERFFFFMGNLGSP